MTTPIKEGLGIARLFMVLSCMSPLFLWWAIRGIKPIPDLLLAPVCLFLMILPTCYLWLRIGSAQTSSDYRMLSISRATDNREHLLVYLFAVLMPLYDTSIGSWRDAAATLCALAFVIFLFYHMNLHYANPLFALCGYQVFTIHPIQGEHVERRSLVLITKRQILSEGSEVKALRVSDTVYFEPGG